MKFGKRSWKGQLVLESSFGEVYDLGFKYTILIESKRSSEISTFEFKTLKLYDLTNYNFQIS